MFLTRLLQGARSVGGRQWSGRNRKSRTPSRHSLKNARKREQMTLANEAILAKPELLQKLPSVIAYHKNLDCCNSRLRRLFERYGRQVARRPRLFVAVPIVVTLLLAIGIVRLHFQTNMEILFTPTNGRGKTERAELGRLFPLDSANEFSPTRQAHAVASAEAIFTAAPDSAMMSDRGRLNEIRRFDRFVREYTANETGAFYDVVCAKMMNGSQCVIDPWLAHRPGLHALAFPFTKEGIFIGASIGGVEFEPNANGLVRAFAAVRIRYFLSNASAAQAWEKAFLDATNRFDSPHVRVVGFTSHSLEEEFMSNGISIVPMFVIAIAAMVAFAVLTVASTDWVRSKPILGLLGVTSTFLGIISAVGLLTAIGVDMSIVVGTMPMLLLGIGVDDMFIMVGAWRRTRVEDSVETRVGETMKDAAVSVTITSLTDLLAFLIGMITVFPSVQGFCLYTGVAVLFDYVYQITFFAGCLALDGRREEANRHAVTFRTVLPRNVALKEEKGTAYRLFCSGGVKHNGEIVVDERYTHPMEKFFGVFGSKLALPPVKVVVLLAFAAYIGVSAWGVSQVNEGLDLHDLVKDDSYAVEYYDKEAKYFVDYGPRVNVLIDERLDYWDAKVQRRVMSMVKQMEDTDYVGRNLTEFWLIDYLNFLRQKGHNPTNLSQRRFIGILRKHFLTNRRFRTYNLDLKFGLDNSIEASRFIVQTLDMSTAKRKQGMMETLRHVVANWPVKTFVYTPEFVYYDQYPAVRPNTLQNIGIALAVMMIVALLMIPHPLGAIVIILSIVSIDVGVVGLMTYWNVNLDSISMINIILCIGFSVDFSAHITYAFMVSDEETRNGKMISALKELGWPNVQGAASTILGVFPLAFSASYVFRTFFKTLFLVIGLGFLHGVVILPVLLSLVGPKSKRRRSYAEAEKTSQMSDSLYKDDPLTAQSDVKLSKKEANKSIGVNAIHTETSV